MFPFEIDRTYVVFAAKDAKGGPATNTCTRTMESSKAADVIAQLGPPTIPKDTETAVTPASFTTKARFSSGATSLSLPTAVATIEPRLGAPGNRWLRVRFYAFPLTPADVAAVTKGNVEPRSSDGKARLAPSRTRRTPFCSSVSTRTEKSGRLTCRFRDTPVRSRRPT